ncbi:hypothetical protein ABFX02_10G177600 [Erythranthe guttata]
MAAFFNLSSSTSLLASKTIVKLYSNYSKHIESPEKRMLYICRTRNPVIKCSGISPVFQDTTAGQGVDMCTRDGIGIVQFLTGKSFLVTGGTGFLGKVLIEKILRTAPDISKIFVLIKAKNKEAAAQRLKNEIIDEEELFKGLRQIHGKSYQAFMLSKLVPVVGNVCESGLGVDEDEANFIAKEVDVIINSAANTTFDERYDTALDINTLGPKRIIGFAKNCDKLKLFLQVSTAYVNGQRQGKIMEKPFCFGQSIHASSLPKLSIEDEIKLVSESNESRKMKELGKHRANSFGWQDTYVFTKAMGEMMIDSLRGDIPVVIIRPSIIESTYTEPFPGWIEGNKVMDPLILLYGKGHITGFPGDDNGVLDVVPADMVVNATLAAMAKHGTSAKPGCNIYQVASSVANPLFLKDLVQFVYQHFTSSPFIDSKGIPVRVPPLQLHVSKEDFSAYLSRHTKNRTGLGNLSKTDEKLSRKLDIICKKLVEQANYLADVYGPCTFYGGRFENSNTKRLMGCMSEEELLTFGFDVECINWKDYITNIHIPGLRKHVMKGRGLN